MTSSAVIFSGTKWDLSEDFAYYVRQWEHGYITFEEVLAQTGLKEATFYRRLKELRLNSDEE